MSDTAIRLVLTTTADLGEAERLGRVLVEERLAACATILPGVLSIYHWKGEIESANETCILFKTSAELVQALQGRLHQLHSYEVPEFIVVSPEAVAPLYLNWLERSLRQQPAQVE
jgi:periplasmic divalent cation tolerance protein